MATAESMSPKAGSGGALKRALNVLSERMPGKRGHLAQIRHRVEAVPGLPAGAVNVEIWEGIAMLKGEVPTAELRKEVERAVAAVHHSRRINNFLRVTGEASA